MTNAVKRQSVCPCCEDYYVDPHGSPSTPRLWVGERDQWSTPTDPDVEVRMIADYPQDPLGGARCFLLIGGAEMDRGGETGRTAPPRTFVRGYCGEFSDEVTTDSTISPMAMALMLGVES